jgi:hypothetical protein
MRRSTLFLSFLGLLIILLASAATDAAYRRARSADHLRSASALVRTLGLTDLCLFTEARYTRHPSQADLHTAFQDHPLSLEHFPSGSLLTPPAFLKESHASVD